MLAAFLCLLTSAVHTTTNTVRGTVSHLGTRFPRLRSWARMRASASMMGTWAMKKLKKRQEREWWKKLREGGEEGEGGKAA